MEPGTGSSCRPRPRTGRARAGWPCRSSSGSASPRPRPRGSGCATRGSAPGARPGRGRRGAARRPADLLVRSLGRGLAPGRGRSDPHRRDRGARADRPCRGRPPRLRARRRTRWRRDAYAGLRDPDDPLGPRAPGDLHDGRSSGPPRPVRGRGRVCRRQRMERVSRPRASPRSSPTVGRPTRSSDQEPDPVTGPQRECYPAVARRRTSGSTSRPRSSRPPRMSS